MCSIEAKTLYIIKQIENCNFTFTYHHNYIVDVEDSESSLNVVRSHDP